MLASSLKQSKLITIIMNENQNSLKDKVKETTEKGQEKINQTRQSSA